jgi:hypothetical protein
LDPVQLVLHWRMNKPIRLKPDYSGARANVGQTLVRAVTASAMQACHKGSTASRIVAEAWPHDNAVPLVIRAASTPTVLADNPVASSAVADFFTSLGPQSAGAAVLGRGLSFTFGDGAIITVPNITSAAGGASFVTEGGAIPVRQLSATSLVLWPRKLAVICVLNREIFEHSTPNILPIVKTALIESTALQLDTLLFDAVAGDTVRPPGLRFNVGAITKSASTDALTAMVTDIGAICASVRAVAAGNPVLVVMSPAQAQRFKLRMSGGNDYGFELFSTSALADGVIIALASNALASALSPVPRIDVSIQATLVMDDAAGPFDKTQSVRSAFQTDAVAIKVNFEAYWGLRSSSGVAWITGITAW